MFDPSVVVSHLIDAEQKIVAYAEELRQHIEAAESFVAGLRGTLEVSSKLADEARQARADAEAAVAVAPTLSDVKALVDRLV